MKVYVFHRGSRDPLKASKRSSNDAKISAVERIKYRKKKGNVNFTNKCRSKAFN